MHMLIHQPNSFTWLGHFKAESCYAAHVDLEFMIFLAMAFPVLRLHQTTNVPCL